MTGRGSRPEVRLPGITPWRGRGATLASRLCRYFAVRFHLPALARLVLSVNPWLIDLAAGAERVRLC